MTLANLDAEMIDSHRPPYLREDRAGRLRLPCSIRLRRFHLTLRVRCLRSPQSRLCVRARSAASWLVAQSRHRTDAACPSVWTEAIVRCLPECRGGTFAGRLAAPAGVQRQSLAQVQGGTRRVQGSARRSAEAEPRPGAGWNPPGAGQGPPRLNAYGVCI